MHGISDALPHGHTSRNHMTSHCCGQECAEKAPFTGYPRRLQGCLYSQKSLIQPHPHNPTRFHTSPPSSHPQLTYPEPPFATAQTPLKIKSHSNFQKRKKKESPKNKKKGISIPKTRLEAKTHKESSVAAAIYPAKNPRAKFRNQSQSKPDKKEIKGRVWCRQKSI